MPVHGAVEERLTGMVRIIVPANYGLGLYRFGILFQEKNIFRQRLMLYCRYPEDIKNTCSRSGEKSISTMAEYLSEKAGRKYNV